MDIGKILGSSLINPLLGNFSAVDQVTQRGIQTPEQQSVSPQMKALEKRQLELANQYRQDIPQMQQEQQSINSDTARQNVASGLQANKRSNQSKGRLYSGLKQGDDTAVKTQAATNLAYANQKSNQALQSQADAMDNAALQTSLQNQAEQQKLNDLYYQQALNNMNRRQGSLQGLLGGAGSLIGGLS